MMEYDDDLECPGDGRCHGCMQWCSNCGDVDLTCDAPECDSHPRIEDVVVEVCACQWSVKRLERELEQARKELIEVNNRLAHYQRGPYRMVSGTKMELIRHIMDS